MHAPATSSGQSATAAKTAPAQSPSDPEQVVLETTQQYYKSVDHLLADLKSRKGEERTIGQIGVWFQSYANRVDRLPILNVDEEMLQYGQYVAQQLRNASMAIKGFGINKRVAEVNADSNAAPFGGVLGESASAYYANGALRPTVGSPRCLRLGAPPGSSGNRILGRQIRNATSLCGPCTSGFPTDSGHGHVGSRDPGTTARGTREDAHQTDQESTRSSSESRGKQMQHSGTLIRWYRHFGRACRHNLFSVGDSIVKHRPLDSDRGRPAWHRPSHA